MNKRRFKRLLKLALSRRLNQASHDEKSAMRHVPHPGFFKENKAIRKHLKDLDDDTLLALVGIAKSGNTTNHAISESETRDFQKERGILYLINRLDLDEILETYRNEFLK